MMIVYGIKNCDTVKKARRWLDDHQFDYQFHDFRTDGLDAGTIKQWLKSISWEALLNKRSTTWRNLDDNQRQDLDQSQAVKLMLAHPTLIKRPVVVDDDRILIGFKEADYRKLL